MVVKLFLEPQNSKGFNLSTLKSKIKKSFGKKLSETTFGATKMIDLFGGPGKMSDVFEVASFPSDPKKGQNSLL